MLPEFNRVTPKSESGGLGQPETWGGRTGPPLAGSYWTVRLTVVECLKLPLVPVIVSGYVPVGVLRLVETCRVEFAGEGGNVTIVGLKVQVARRGQPLILKLTVPAKPFKDVIVAV